MYSHAVVALVTGICSSFSLAAGLLFWLTMTLYGSVTRFGFPQLELLPVDVIAIGKKANVSVAAGDIASASASGEKSQRATPPDTTMTVTL